MDDGVAAEQALRSASPISVGLGTVLSALRLAHPEASDRLSAWRGRRSRNRNHNLRRYPSEPEPGDVPVELRLVEQRATVQLVGAVDVAATAVLAQVEELICNDATVAIVVDCAELSFIDCTGLGHVLEWNSLAFRHRTLLSFRRVPAQFRRLLELCAVEELLPISDYLIGPE